MNLIFDLWILSKDRVNTTKMFCKWIYKVVIIIWFKLYQNIVPKMFLVDALLNTGHLLES